MSREWNDRVRISVMERVVQVPSQEQRVQPRRPFVMIAEKNVWLLPFPSAKGCAGRRRANPGIGAAVLVVILGFVAKFAVIINALQQNTVLRRQLNLAFQRTGKLLQIVIPAPPA